MGQFLNFILAWSPVILIIVLAVGFRRSALTLGISGLVYTVLLTGLWYGTSPKVIALAAADGVVTSLPVLLVVLFGIFLATLLIESGSLKRLVSWITGGISDQWRRTLFFSAGLGNFTEGAGVVAEPLVAPMMTAAGIAPAHAAALSIHGYAGLFSLELAGAIMGVLTAVTGLSLFQLSLDAALLSVIPTLFLVFTIPWLLGEPWAFVGRLALFFFSGLTLSAATLGMVLIGAPSVSAMTGGLLLAILLMLGGGGNLKAGAGLWRDLIPLAIVTLGLLAVNLIPGVRRAAWDVVAVPVSVVPVHQVTLRPLFDAYSFMAIAFVTGLFVIKMGRGQWRSVLLKGGRTGAMAFTAMALFGAMGQVVAFSGYSPDFEGMDGSRNMVKILATGLAGYTGSVYPIFAPLVGWAGTVLTGYGMASVLLLGKLQVTTAEMTGLSPTLLASSMAVGGGVGSISSPFKIAIAAALCGAGGQEGFILRKTMPIGIAATLLVGGTSLLVAWFR